MKTIIALCAVLLTTSITHAENLKIMGFQILFPEGVSIVVNMKGQISHIAAKAEKIKRDSTNTITSIGSADIKREGGYITDIGSIQIKRDSVGDITDIGDLKIKKDEVGTITDIGAASIKRDKSLVITQVSGDVRVWPLFKVH